LAPYFEATAPARPFLLASDIDGTLLGDDESERWIKSLTESLNSKIYFVVITGRSLNAIANLVGEGRLPQPDFICGSTASEPWHYHSPYPAGRGVIGGLRHFGFIE
jgi:hydroxymethylpyrimidine pyrophosphatase-like HAD family hydrolase